jgi:hypothetical protein
MKFAPVITALVVAVGGLAAAAPAAAPASATAPTRDDAAVLAAAPAGDCAWPTMDTAQENNSYYPDTNAAYWTQPFQVGENTTLKVSGTFPDARYAQFAIYDSDGTTFTDDGLNSWVTDYEITADEGSANPFSQANAAPGGSFTLHIGPPDQSGVPNLLPLAPQGVENGQTEFLVYRIYAPAGADFSKVPLPTIALTQDGTTSTLRPCTSSSSTPVRSAVSGTLAPVLDRGAAPAPGDDTAFNRDDNLDNEFPNGDSGYLQSTITPPRNGDVFVVHGKAPAYTHGSAPAVWPTPDSDLRYWSMCSYVAAGQDPVVVNRQPGGSTTYGCASDDETAVDANGYYTYVVGTEAQRQAIARIPGATFLPFSQAHPNTPHTLLFRNMLAADDFHQSVLSVPENGDPATAQTVMGPYYPTSAVCPLAQLEENGVGSCLIQGAGSGN